MREISHFDEHSGKMIVRTVYDNSDVIEANKREKIESRGNKYKGNLVKVASVSEGDVVRLKNLGYNILSPDPDEVRRALCYLQSNESAFLTVEGTPFARNRVKWV